MKTRSNMPLFVVECTDITKLTDGQIDLLRCGDYLVKKTGKQNHAYKVTYKEDKQGICLTYHDASTVETVSYDYTDGHWVYNSTDKADLPINVEGASFKPIYCHPVYINLNRTFDSKVIQLTALIFNNSPTPFTKQTFIQWLKDLWAVAPLAKILTSGFYTTAPLSCLSYAENDSACYVNYASAETAGQKAYFQYADLLLEATVFEDGVNKIN